MGQSVSMRQLNGSYDELTNSLIEDKRILSIDVERAFRCVDRGIYFDESKKYSACYNIALRSDDIHLSSPKTYAAVLENLQLQPGHKFLNIGSGIGYLNTVAGLLIGIHGVNHGIEINQPLLDLAEQKLNEFISNAAAIDHYNFCKPVFIHGNAYQLMATNYYDRVYCGANVVPLQVTFMKSLIKVNGVLILPIYGLYLVKLVRKSEDKWETKRLVRITNETFTDIVIPTDTYKEVKFPPANVLSLKDLCRASIRSYLSEDLQIQIPELKMQTKIKVYDKNTRSDQKNDKLILQNSSSSDDDSEIKEEDNNEHQTEGNILEHNLPCPTLTETSDKLNETKSPEVEDVAQIKLNSLASENRDDYVSFTSHFWESVSDSYSSLSDDNSEIKEENSNELKTEGNILEHNLPCPTLIGTSDKLNETKSPEVEDVEQMKLNSSSSEKSDDYVSDSTSSSSLLISDSLNLSMEDYDNWRPLTSLSWELLSDLSSSSSSLDSESWNSSMEYNAEEEYEEYLNEDHYSFDGFFRFVNSGNLAYEIRRKKKLQYEAKKYRFVKLCTVNQLSIHMKKKIDSLPIPTLLKNFLNYFRYK